MCLNFVKTSIVDKNLTFMVSSLYVGMYVLRYIKLPFRLRSDQHEDPESYPLVKIPLLYSYSHDQTSKEQKVGVLKISYPPF